MSFARFFGFLGKSATAGDRPRPDATLSVIGDVHGCDDALSRLLAMPEVAAGQLVFVGDLIDRGPDSKAVLDRVIGLARDGAASVIMGNHERMLLDFLDNPSGKARRWLTFGGAQTLESYGIAPPPEGAPPRRLNRVRDALAAALGEDAIAWLRARPLVFSSGNVAVVHAGADPERAMDEQRAAVLLWGHENLGAVARRDGTWIVHGHSVVRRPRDADGVISIDTGAYSTGVLSAAVISPNGQVGFFSTEA